jgi:hypothetical protein
MPADGGSVRVAERAALVPASFDTAPLGRLSVES